jgi:hypothetical protein
MSGYCPDCGNTLCICSSELEVGHSDNWIYTIKKHTNGMEDEIINLKKQLELSQKREAILEKANKFYAQGTSYNWDWCDSFMENDIDFNDELQLSITGRRARQALKEVEEIK